MNMHDMQMQEGASSETGRRDKHRRKADSGRQSWNQQLLLLGDPLAPAVWRTGTMNKRSYGTAGNNLALEACTFGVMCVHVGETWRHMSLQCASVLVLCKMGWFLMARRSEETFRNFLFSQNIFSSTPSRT